MNDPPPRQTLSWVLLLQMVTVKSKYIVENQTGMVIEFKQMGTPDLYPGDACVTAADPLERSVRQLHLGERAAVHWDNADLDRMLVMRPLEGENCTRCDIDP